ncbi:hypothetical protein [Kitasatospora sp. GAS1066B]|uniref:hypothetical protein n=1 Tax=Kitasatospora sp. GAS1066B TaxID=3156271 RepID=UPI0035138381
MASPAPAVPTLAGWPPLVGPAAALVPALLDWAARQDGAAPRLCLITGGPGAGKSHLLAWLLAGSDSDPRTTVHATVPAGGQIAQTVAWELGHQLGYGPLSPEDLIARVAADPRPLRLLLPDLHHAGRGPADLPTARPQDVVERLVAPLLALPHVRAAVEVGQLDLLPAQGALTLDLGPTAYDPTAPEAPGAPGTADPFGTRTDNTPLADWRTAPAALRERALDRALAAGTAVTLLKDPGFLVHGSLAAITATLGDERLPLPARLRTVWECAAPALSTPAVTDPERAAILHAAALGADPRLAEFLRPLAGSNRWNASWAQPTFRASSAALLPAATPAAERLVTVDPLGRVRLHRADDGALIRRVTVDPKLRPTVVAAAAADRLLALDADGILHPLMVGEAGSGGADTHYLALHHNAITVESASNRPTAIGSSAGRFVVGDDDGRVHLWSLTTLQSGPRTNRLHRTAITAVDCAVLPDTGVTLLVSAGLDGTVRLWDSASGAAMPEPVERRTTAVPTALALAETAAGPVLAVAWSDQRLHLWQLFEGRLTPLPLLHPATALALRGDATLIVAGERGATALRLDLDTLWS